MLIPTGSLFAAGPPEEPIAFIAKNVNTAPIAAAIANLMRRPLVLRRSVSMSRYDTASRRALHATPAERSLTRRGMRIVLGLLVVSFGTARAAPPPSWADLPALLAAAEAPVDAELRACVHDKLPRTLGISISRAKDGSTEVGMPVLGVGYRGYTPEERCLGRAVAKITLPPLPPEIVRMTFGLTIGTAPSFDTWRDVPATLATLLDADKRAALAACDVKARTVRVILDVRHKATTAWLPAWQFHSATGDGTTPPAQQRVKKCLSKAVRTWTAPLLPPSVVGEIELAIRTAR